MLLKDVFIENELYQFIDEQRIINEGLKEVGSTLPAAGVLSSELIRKNRLYNKDGSFKPILIDPAYDDSIDVDGLNTPIRIFPIKNHAGVYLHFHGGGFTLGSIHEQDYFLWELARQTSMTVLTVGYPLAPESTLLNTLEITTAVAIKVMDRFSSEKFCYGGESAGGNVMLNTLLRVAKRPEYLARIKGLNLSYGVFDMSKTPSQRVWGEEFINLSTPFLEWFYSMCAPNMSDEERRTPELSPLYADLSNLPPTIFSVGALDPLFDDTLFMAMKWWAAGNDAELKVYPESPHGFNGIKSQMGQACNTKIYQFLSAAITA